MVTIICYYDKQLFRCSVSYIMETELPGEIVMWRQPSFGGHSVVLSVPLVVLSRSASKIRQRFSAYVRKIMPILCVHAAKYYSVHNQILNTFRTGKAANHERGRTPHILLRQRPSVSYSHRHFSRNMRHIEQSMFENVRFYMDLINKKKIR